MTDKRTSTLAAGTEPRFLEKLDIPMGDVRMVPLDQKAPFHAYAYTPKDPQFIGAYATIQDARDRILDYAASALSVLFESPLYTTVLGRFRPATT